MAWYSERGNRKKKKRLVMLVSGVALAMLLVVITASVAASRRRRHGSSPFSASSFGQNYDITWASDHARVTGDGQQVDLILDSDSGAGFGSKNRYLFGNLGMQIRLVQNDSSGTVVAYYMSSLTDDGDQFSFQFFGNATGQAYTLQTNVFVKGVGGREQRLHLWFDPSANFHLYSLVWNEHQVIFMVDRIPIRVFKDNSNVTVPYPSSRPMGIYTSIWAGALAGAPVINWQHAPFVVSYLNTFSIDACQYSDQSPDECHKLNNRWWSSLQWNSELQGNLSVVQGKYVAYNYCNDQTRYPTPPPECSFN